MCVKGGHTPPQPLSDILIAMKYLFGITVLALLAFSAWTSYDKHQQTQEVDELKNAIARLERELQEREAREKVYTMVAGGDLMLDRGVEAKIKKLGKDYDFAFDKVRDYLKSADLVFANLEGSLSDVGADLGSVYSFRFEVAVAQALADAGIDVVSLANNHMLDWGRASLCATTTNLRNVSIDFVGAGCNSAEAERPHMTTLGNTRIAFLAYTEFYKGAHATASKAGMSEYDMEKITARIAALKQEPNVDIVMVSMHWGEEYQNRATDAQVRLGQRLVDAGADVVIGHHPHVDQEIERYGDGWIIYSLGNFVFDQSWSEETMQGLLAEIHIQDGKILDVVPKPIQLNAHYQPYLVEN